MTRMIDLNADLGEDESPAGIARDIAIMDIVSSCNIACGGHAGSPETMRTMLSAAKSKVVSAGAHPSYPDRDNFGRKSIYIPLEELEASLLEQLQQLLALAAEVGVTVSHIKPHGALYNDAQDDAELSSLLVGIASRRNLALVGMPGSLMQQSADEKNINFIAEAFIDRRYREDGRLVPRGESGAVIANEGDRIDQGLALAKETPIIAQNGARLKIAAQSLCLHSDSDGALDTAKRMRSSLESAGILIGSPR